MKDVVVVFAEEIKKQRLRCGYTQKEVEDLLCLPRGTFEKWEKGKKEPSLSVLVVLSDFFMCSTDTLLGKNSR